MPTLVMGVLLSSKGTSHGLGSEEDSKPQVDLLRGPHPRPEFWPLSHQTSLLKEFDVFLSSSILGSWKKSFDVHSYIPSFIYSTNIDFEVKYSFNVF